MFFFTSISFFLRLFSQFGCKGTTFFAHMQDFSKKNRKSAIFVRFFLSYRRRRLVLRLVVLGSRANPSYMYLNYVQVVSTRGSSAFPTANATLVYVGDPKLTLAVGCCFHLRDHLATINVRLQVAIFHLNHPFS
jgi:hypothetical protein